MLNVSKYMVFCISFTAWISLLAAPASAQEASAELTFEPESQGRTLFKVLEPEDAACVVAEGGLSRRYTVPFSLPAAEHSFYRFTCRLPDGSVWTQTLEPRPRQVNILRVKARAALGSLINPLAPSALRKPAAPPAVPAPLDAESFNSLAAAIKQEGFSDGKLRVIQQAAASGYFTIAQVGQVVQLLSFSDDKINAVRILKPRILDPQNASQLQRLFSFSSDKQQVQQLFAR